MVEIDNAVKVVKMYDQNCKIAGNMKIDDNLKTLDSYRTIPLRKEYEKILIELKEREKKRLGGFFREDGYVFLNKNNDPYTPEILTNKMPDFLKKWNLPHITPYGLRHSFASLMSKMNVKESVLRAMMGHKDISTTHKYYIHLTNEDIMEEVVSKLEEKKQLKNGEKGVDIMMIEKMDELMKMIQESQGN